MNKPLVLAVALVTAGVSQVLYADQPPPQSQVPAWVAESNQDAQILLKTFADLAPEQAGQFGVDGLDDQASSLTPDFVQRADVALDQDLTQLNAKLAAATDPKLRQDLQIMITAAANAKHDNELQTKYFLNYTNVAQMVFFGVQTLIDPQVPAERQQAVVKRLQSYTGLLPGRPPITEQAKVLFENDLKRDPKLLGPYKGQVEQDLKDDQQYIPGIEQLLAGSKVQGWQEPWAKLKAQLTDYSAWVQSDVMPHARAANRMPEEVYTNNLHDLGVDEDPRALIKEAEFSFSEIQHQLEGMAILVAKQDHLKSSDYRDVIRELKKQQLKPDNILPFYRNRLRQIEAIIRKEHIVTLPQRQMMIRMGSKAETAAEPAPHMDAPRLIGNTGQYGSFILPDNAGQKGGMDDDTFDAAAWTLTAHEGRPGHELQFASMIENHTSIARALFAFNSANVEGWALYSEAEMQPYEPLEGQMIALRDRLLRAARAFLDPMVNLGMITPDQAKEFLMREVVASPAFAQEEANRFAFQLPGQATSYYYGYHNFLTMRGRAQVELGDKFNRQKFNDFVLSQGLLPPDLMQKAIDEEFIPSQK
ncbi:MAG TPA: DUF885 domain-containing protein [Gammaproteobacteria bacterium]|nr:DUF885 domain-containing protein [Gammaproteobacteria bacterium]